MNKRKGGYFPLLGFCLLVLVSLTGCASDPFVRASVINLRDSSVTIMDEHDRMAEAAGKPKLPAEYRKDKIGAYNDLVDYLDGVKPEAVRK